MVVYSIPDLISVILSRSVSVGEESPDVNRDADYKTSGDSSLTLRMTENKGFYLVITNRSVMAFPDAARTTE